MRRAGGFTLLEVMVAVLVFGLIATAAARVAGNYITGYERVRDKTMAGWIADNEVSRLRLGSSLPPVSESARDIHYGRSDWQVTTQVAGTSEAGMRRVEVTVGRYPGEGEKPYSVLTLQAFIGNGR